MKQSILLQQPNTCKTGCIDYLKVNNKLSEFDTPEKKLAAIRNLGINQIEVVQNLGDDPTVVMSQKAVTSSINESNLIKIYESENNLPTSAETGRFAAVVHQIDNIAVTELFFKNPQSWEKVGAIKTVNSEEQLYEDDPIGTLKIIAYDGIKTANFKELYQPNKDEIDIDQMIFNTENLSKVTKLYIDELATINDNIHMILFIARNHENVTDPCIILNTEGYALVVDFGDNNVKHELQLFERTETGILINEIGLNTVNNYLSTDEYCFGGIYDIDNNIVYDNIDVFKVDGFVQRGALYFKEVDGWKNYSAVLKTSEYQIEKNTEQIALVEKELHNSIVKVNYVEDLDPKAPSGTLASVNFTNTTLEEFDGGFYTVTLQFPNEIYIDPNYTTSELYYYPANINVDGTFGGMLSSPHCGLRFYNTGNEQTINDISNHNIIVTYEDGVLREVNNEALQQFYHTVNQTIGSWKVRNGYLPKLSEEQLQIWQNFIEQPFIFSNPTLFVKKSKGWEQYNKILDNSITRDKIRDYTITEDKLEYPLQLKLDSVSTLVQTTNTLQTNLNTEIQNRTTQDSELRTSINSINDKLSELENNIELADGSIAIEKLSTDVQESITKVNTFLDIAAQSDEVVDTLKEIQEYIESDASGASAMITDIATNKSNIEELTARLDELNNNENNSVEIVNDLTTGGADKALSAEMGKTLSERIEEVAEITNSGEEVTVQIVDEDAVGIPLAGIRKQTSPSDSSPFYPYFVSEKDVTNNEDADTTPGSATVVYLDDYTSSGIYVIKEYEPIHDTYNDIFAFVGFPAKYGTESNSDAYISESLIIKESRYTESGIEAFAQYKYDSSIYRLNDESSADNGKLYSFNNTRIIQEVTPKKSVSIQEAIDDIYSKLALLTT